MADPLTDEQVRGAVAVFQRIADSAIDYAVVSPEDCRTVLAALRDVREQRAVAEQFAMALGIIPASELKGIAKERYEKWLQRVSDRMDAEGKA